MIYTYDQATQLHHTLANHALSAFQNKDMDVFSVYYDKIQSIQKEIAKHERLICMMDKAITEAIKRPNGWEHFSMVSFRG